MGVKGAQSRTYIWGKGGVHSQTQSLYIKLKEFPWLCMGEGVPGPSASSSQAPVGVTTNLTCWELPFPPLLTSPHHLRTDVPVPAQLPYYPTPQL